MMICSTCVHAGTYHSRLIIQKQNQPPNSEMARSTQGDRERHTERQMNDKTSPRLIPISRSRGIQEEYSSNRSIVICDDKCSYKRILRTGGATAAEGGDEDKSKDDDNNKNLLQQ